MWIHIRCFNGITLAIKQLKIISSFLKIFFGEKRLVESVKLLPVNKSNTKRSTHYWIKCLYSKNICLYVFVPKKCFNFIWNVCILHQTYQKSNIIIPCIQSNPMSFNIRILIKINYILFHQADYLYKGWGDIKNP